jgi:hypothetical protein
VLACAAIVSSSRIDDPRQVVIDLDFDTTDQARRFLHQTTVWASPQNAPALVGAPHTRILQPVAEQ